jgi:flagellar hook-basal body complex protein FliE
MDFKLTLVSVPTSVQPNLTVRPTGVNPVDAGGGSFSGALKSALSSVSAAQNKSGRLQREVQMENPKVSLEETMVAIQKAQIGFQSVLHVRNRMVQTYTDIMNIQV